MDHHHRHELQGCGCGAVDLFTRPQGPYNDSGSQPPEPGANRREDRRVPRLSDQCRLDLARGGNGTRLPCAVRFGERSEIFVDFENIADKQYRAISWGIDGAGGAA
jgi:hypothetical protein